MRTASKDTSSRWCYRWRERRVRTFASRIAMGPSAASQPFGLARAPMDSVSAFGGTAAVCALPGRRCVYCTRALTGHRDDLVQLASNTEHLHKIADADEFADPTWYLGGFLSYFRISNLRVSNTHARFESPLASARFQPSGNEPLTQKPEQSILPLG